MTVSRYYFLPKLGNRFIGTSDQTTTIFNATDSGAITCVIKQLDANTRLDILAYESYGDASLWWIIAAASGIGWSMQLSPGTYVRIPTDLNAVYEILRTA